MSEENKNKSINRDKEEDTQATVQQVAAAGKGGCYYKGKLYPEGYKRELKPGEAGWIPSRTVLSTAVVCKNGKWVKSGFFSPSK